MTTTRKQSPAQARKAALESDYTPFYAVAGLTQAVAGTLQQTSAKASERFAAWQDANEKQAKATAEDLTRFVRTLPEQVKALPDTTRSRLADWQQQAAGLVRDANAVYAELAGKGKLVVDDTLGTARQFGGKAEKRAGDVLSDVADTVDPAFERAQEGVTQARKATTGRTATATMTPRSARKAAATRATNRGPAGETSPARKSAAQKAAARKTTAKRTQPAAKKQATGENQAG